MRQIFKKISFILLLGVTLMAPALFAEPVSAQGSRPSCQGRFLTFPVWYRGLDGATECQPKVRDLGDAIRIGLNVIEILIQAVGYLSGFFILWGGIQYATSLGEPDKIASAKSTITNAIIGLVISMLAVAIVSLIGGVV